MVLVATGAQESAWGIAIHTAQRLAIESDNTWNELNQAAGAKGLKAARAIGMLTYRNYEAFVKTQTDEDKIRDFVLRNSKNGYYTKVSTLSYKFEIPEAKAWEIVGGLLIDGSLESVHDEFTGEMKLCESGKTYLIMNLEQQRRKQKGGREGIASDL